MYPPRVGSKTAEEGRALPVCLPRRVKQKKNEKKAGVPCARVIHIEKGGGGSHPPRFLATSPQTTEKRKKRRAYLAPTLFASKMEGEGHTLPVFLPRRVRQRKRDKKRGVGVVQKTLVFRFERRREGSVVANHHPPTGPTLHSIFSPSAQGGGG